MAENGGNGSTPAAATPARACPICGKPAVPQFRPFCSKRCTDIDLHRWLSGRYAIPVKEEEDEDGALPAGGTMGPDEEPDKH